MRKLLFVLAVCLGASAASAANNLNQYTTITRSDGTVANLTYDRNGNLTGDGTWTYTYDPENHLISATKPGTTAIYAYDPLGRRVSKTVHGVKTVFLWDGDTLLAEYDAGGHLIRAYAPGPINPSTGGADYVAMLNATHDPALTEFLLENHQGSIVATVNAAGNRIEGPLTYDAYGLPCGASGTHCPPSTPPGVPFRFTGMYYDAETGLYYDHARYYSPVLGRFLQTDPVGYGPDPNLYTYTGNDPANRADPSGECDPKVASCLPGTESKNGMAQLRAAISGQNSTPVPALPQADETGSQNPAQQDGQVDYKPGVPPGSAPVQSMLTCTANCLGGTLRVTSTNEAIPPDHPVHEANDPHRRDGGLAADVTGQNPSAIMECAAQCGAAYQKNEYAHPSANAVGGGHVHLQLVPGRGGATGPYYPIPVPIPRPDGN